MNSVQRRFTLVLAIVLAPFLHATTFRFDPPVPTNTTTTVVSISGQWPDNCPPSTATPVREGQRITLVVPPPVVGCLATSTRFIFTANLGVVPAGVYQLATDPPVVSTTLVVRDVTTLIVEPAVIPIGGGQLRITSPRAYGSFDPLHITIGGTPVNAYVLPGDLKRWIYLAAPPHAAGPADIEIISDTLGHQLAPAALTYYDPNAATPDPFVFTQLLFPIDFAGPGAFGSNWTTENELETSDEHKKLPITGSASGVVVPVLRNTNVAASSRIRDLSRTSQTAGTEIPVVHENDFGNGLRLINIPTGKNFRALLRVWTSGEPPAGDQFFLNFDQIATIVAMHGALVPVQGGLRYGTFDITPFLFFGDGRLDLSAGVATIGTRMWGMVSITNNDTQQVTIVSPH